MAIYSVTGAELTSVADAIRAKGGTTDLLAFPSGFVSAVQDITTGGMSLSAADEGKVVYNGALSLQGSMNVSSNGSYDTTLFSQVSVAIPEAVLVSKTITSNGIYNPSNDNADGFSQVSVAIPEAVLVSKTITSNGTYNPASDNADAFSQVVVNVPSEGGGGVIGSENYLVVTRQSSGAFVDSEITIIQSRTFYSNIYIQKAVCNNATSIGYSAFASCTQLSIANFPECTTIDASAFEYCSSLMDVSFPKCTSISVYAFNRCSKLYYANFPECKTVYQYAFSSCGSLSEISLPKCTEVHKNAFFYCILMESVFIPNVAKIYDYAFALCSKISRIDFPSCWSIGSGAFSSCTGLEFVSLPALENLYTATFSNCTNLSEAYFPIVSSIGTQAFVNCTKLEKVVLLSTQVAQITSNTFNSTPMQNSAYLGYFGSIYVPASLVDAYKSANYWSAISDRITSYVEG